MPIPVGYKLNPTNQARVEAALRKVARHGADLTLPFNRFGTKFVRRTVQSFNRGGRLGNWPPYSDFTLALRKARGKKTSPRGMLKDRGVLQNSIKHNPGPKELVVGTTVPYAPLQQKGGYGTLKLAATTIYPRAAKALAFTTKDGKQIICSRVSMPARTIRTKIPARPFLVVLPADELDLLHEVERHIAKVVR